MRDTEREKEREEEKEEERDRAKKRDHEKEREKEREKARDRATQREREKEREKKMELEKDREKEREAGAGGSRSSSRANSAAASRTSCVAPPVAPEHVRRHAQSESWFKKKLLGESSEGSDADDDKPRTHSSPSTRQPPLPKSATKRNTTPQKPALRPSHPATQSHAATPSYNETTKIAATPLHAANAATPLHAATTPSAPDLPSSEANQNASQKGTETSGGGVSATGLTPKGARPQQLANEVLGSLDKGAAGAHDDTACLVEGAATGADLVKGAAGADDAAAHDAAAHDAAVKPAAPGASGVNESVVSESVTPKTKAVAPSASTATNTLTFSSDDQDDSPLPAALFAPRLVTSGTAIADSAAAAGKDLFSPRANTDFVNALNEGLSDDDDEAFSNALRRGR